MPSESYKILFSDLRISYPYLVTYHLGYNAPDDFDGNNQIDIPKRDFILLSDYYKERWEWCTGSKLLLRRTVY